MNMKMFSTKDLSKNAKNVVKTIIKKGDCILPSDSIIAELIEVGFEIQKSGKEHILITNLVIFEEFDEELGNSDEDRLGFHMRRI